MKHWNVISAQKGFTGKWIDINLDNVQLPDGKILHYEAANYHCPGVGIVAENENNEIILVRNYRYITDFTGWEIPAGTVSAGQKHSDCIIEELKEEAGCIVGKNSLEYLGFFYPSIGSSNQVFHCYFVDNVKQEFPHLDKNEILETRWFSKEELKELIKTGKIKDGFSLNLLMYILLELHK